MSTNDRFVELLRQLADLPSGAELAAFRMVGAQNLEGESTEDRLERVIAAAHEYLRQQRNLPPHPLRDQLMGLAAGDVGTARMLEVRLREMAGGGSGPVLAKMATAILAGEVDARHACRKPEWDQAVAEASTVGFEAFAQWCGEATQEEFDAAQRIAATVIAGIGGAPKAEGVPRT